MATAKIRPHLVYADSSGNIYDHPDLFMLCRRGNEIALPRPDELIPLPDESEFFLLPQRNALGLDPESGVVEGLAETAVAAFISPGYTLTGHAAYHTNNVSDVPVLPLFAYGAVGYAAGKFWVAAKKVDEDARQIFTHIPQKKIQQGARDWMRQFPNNRLVQHLMGCALTSCCPAARNLCIGRFEAPLPTSRACNAACVGCISLQSDDSGFPSTQNRIRFLPKVRELVEIMERHSAREKRSIFSFGQGCEGEPLTEAKRITESIAAFRSKGGRGTMNINTNGSLPDTIADLASAGLNSIRVSLNSAGGALYDAYYRPKSYEFCDVRATIKEAKRAGLFVSLNYLYFPGVSDTETELALLEDLVDDTQLDFIQLRNLNLDPELYLGLAAEATPQGLGPAMGFNNYRKRLRKNFKHLKFGYFNPYLGD